MTSESCQHATVTGLFLTPVLNAPLADAIVLNADLRAVILAREASHLSEAHSNLGGWQSDTAFLDWGGPAAGPLRATVTRAMDGLKSNRAGQPVKADWHCNALANVNAAAVATSPTLIPAASSRRIIMSMTAASMPTRRWAASWNWPIRATSRPPCMRRISASRCAAASRPGQARRYG